jgi:cyclic pyranopterin phosphate synthase
MNDKEFSHIDANNNPSMVDVSHKTVTQREATAQSSILLTHEIVAQFKDGEISSKKGPVLQTAIIAGTMAVKKTSELIPFCHPLAIEKCTFRSELNGLLLTLFCTVRISGKTGVEMEALVGASTATLTIYDMCKGLSHDMVISDTKLISKTGGKSDFNSKER